MKLGLGFKRTTPSDGETESFRCPTVSPDSQAMERPDLSAYALL